MRPVSRWGSLHPTRLVPDRPPAHMVRAGPATLSPTACRAWSLALWPIDYLPIWVSTLIANTLWNTGAGLLRLGDWLGAAGIWIVERWGWDHSLRVHMRFGIITPGQKPATRSQDTDDGSLADNTGRGAGCSGGVCGYRGPPLRTLGSTASGDEPPRAGGMPFPATPARTLEHWSTTRRHRTGHRAGPAGTFDCSCDSERCTLKGWVMR